MPNLLTYLSLEGFTCRLGKAEQLPLLWGGRSCVSIANYRFGEGVHPVRVNTRHCDGGKCIGLVATPTSLKDDCKRGECIGLGGQSTCYSKRSEARRGNPVEQRLIFLDCFTTLAMTIIPLNSLILIVYPCV